MSSPRHARARPHRTWPQRLLLSTLSVFTVVAVLAAAGLSYVYWKTGRFNRADVTLDARRSNEDPINYLLIGSDSREAVDETDPNAGLILGGDTDGRRSDTIIVVRVEPDTGQIYMLSLPRDLWVPIAGHGTAKINSAFSHGRQTLIDTIRSNFGISINNYIEVDLVGFQKLVDALDGVNLYFPTPARDEHSGLFIDEPGCHTLNGSQALAYARSRYFEIRDDNGRWRQDPLSDISRTKRQQTFIRKAADKALSKNPTDVLTFNSLLDVATSSVTLDRSIDRGGLKRLVDQFSGIDPDEIVSLGLAVTDSTSRDGQSILLIDEDDPDTINALNVFRGLPPGTLLERQVTVDVYNGTGVEQQATQVSLALAAVGFRTGNASDIPSDRTVIRYAPGSETAADLLARHLSGPALLQIDEDLAPNRVALITGADFRSVMQQVRPSTTTTTAAAPAPNSDGPASGADGGPEGGTGDGQASTTLPTTTTTTNPFLVGLPPEGVRC